VFVKNYSILIWIGLLAVFFGILWYGGQLARLSVYVSETREELKKCTWPTWAELRGSSVVVLISIALLGLFTFVVDLVFRQLMYLLT
jgi:preprotein translocase subunit SecE